MIGPVPYKKPKPKTKDESPDLKVNGVDVPTELNVKMPEFIGLAESPDVQVPSTFDDALINDQLLENPELIEANTVSVFPTIGSKEFVSYGVPPPSETDRLAFGGNYGQLDSLGVEPTQSSALDKDETALLLQNTIFSSVSDVDAGTTSSGVFELGTKLAYQSQQQQLIGEILSTQFPDENLDTQVVDDLPVLQIPEVPIVIDGGEF
jgi:hypothetical protein